MEKPATQDVIKIIENTIHIATPRNTCRGRQDRNRLVKAVMGACREMMYDKRMNKQ